MTKKYGTFSWDKFQKMLQATDLKKIKVVIVDENYHIDSDYSKYNEEYQAIKDGADLLDKKQD